MEDFEEDPKKWHPSYNPKQVGKVISQADIEGVIETAGLDVESGDDTVITVEVAKQALEKAKENIAEQYHKQVYGHRINGANHMRFDDHFEG